MSTFAPCFQVSSVTSCRKGEVVPSYPEGSWQKSRLPSAKKGEMLRQLTDSFTKPIDSNQKSQPTLLFWNTSVVDISFLDIMLTQKKSNFPHSWLVSQGTETQRPLEVLAFSTVSSFTSTKCHAVWWVWWCLANFLSTLHKVYGVDNHQQAV